MRFGFSNVEKVFGEENVGMGGKVVLDTAIALS